MSTPTPEYYLKRIPLSEKDKENGYVTVDPYRIARLWELKDPALFQAFKKTLCGGQRGGKDLLQDVKEARDALSRWLELEEVENPCRYLLSQSGGCILRIHPNGERYAQLITLKDRWEEVSPNDPEENCNPISEAQARALVEKAGGVW